jgi:hypothetical protein
MALEYTGFHHLLTLKQSDIPLFFTAWINELMRRKKQYCPKLTYINTFLQKSSTWYILG